MAKGLAATNQGCGRNSAAGRGVAVLETSPQKIVRKIKDDNAVFGGAREWLVGIKLPEVFEHFFQRDVTQRLASPLSPARAGTRWAANGPLFFPTAPTRRSSSTRR